MFKREHRARWQWRWYFFIASVVVVALGNELVELKSFHIPYADLETRGFSRPVTSLAQIYSDRENDAAVLTALPVHVPRRVTWDIRGVTVDVVVGRRIKGAKGGFDVDWDARFIFSEYPSLLSVYPDCEGMPCAVPTKNFRNASRVVGTRDPIREMHSWGSVYHVTVVISSNPSEPGMIGQANTVLWLSYAMELPTHYHDAITDLDYEISHWVAVWSSAKPGDTLAFRDIDNILNHNWGQWQSGNALQFVLYEGLSHPTPGFSIIGYITDLSTPAPVATSPLPTPTTQEPSSAATPPTNAPVTIPKPADSLVGIWVLVVSIGGIILLLIGAACYGKWRKRKHTLAKRKAMTDIMESGGVPLYKDTLPMRYDSSSEGSEAERRKKVFRNRTSEAQLNPLDAHGGAVSGVSLGNSFSGSDDDDDVVDSAVAFAIGPISVPLTSPSLLDNAPASLDDKRTGQNFMLLEKRD